MAFNLTTLSEYAKVQGGFAYKSKDFIESSDNKVLKIKNVRFGTVNYEDSAFVSNEIAQSTKLWETQEGDILISMTGSGPNAPQSLVGRVARIWPNEPKAYINQRVGRIKLKEEGKVHSDFLFYLLSLPQSQDFLVSNSSGSANQANISGKIIEMLPCPEVTFEESKSIANIARSLDEKIILNRQTNQTLEQMAQALFKSWFVDFDPVFDNALASGMAVNDLPEALQKKAEQRIQVQQQIANGEPSADKKADAKPLPEDILQLFPSEFEQTDEPSIGINGWIPKGWFAGNLSSMAKFTSDRIEGSELTLDNYISTDNMIANKGGVENASKLPDLKTTPAFKPGDILISNIRPYFKKIWLASYSGGRSNDVLGFEALNTNSKEYLLNLLYQDTFFDYMMTTSKGSKMPRGDKKAVMDWGVSIPPSELQEYFSKFVRNYYQVIPVRNKEIGLLTNLRDTLLPKLISGELTINKEVA